MTSPKHALEEQADALLHEFELEEMAHEATRPSGFSPASTDPKEVFGDVVPDDVLSFVESIARTKEVQLLLLERVHEFVCRRLATDVDSREAARLRWTRAWKTRPAQLKARLGRARDEVVRVAHFGATLIPSKLTGLPRRYRMMDPISGDSVAVSDPPLPLNDLGHAAYLEHTPGEIVWQTHAAWEAGNSTRRGPDVWDLTAGSGTVAEYFLFLGRGRCISSDLVVIQDEVTRAPAQQAGRLVEHTMRSFVGEVPLRIPRPDIVFFDPPSLGTPTHSDLYQGDEPHRDFASLSPEDWICEVGSIARNCVDRLARGGVLSLLVRAGRRRGPLVEPLPEMTEALLAFLGSPEVQLPQVDVLSRFEVTYRGRHLNQAGLGKSRVPATHLLLGRPS